MKTPIAVIYITDYKCTGHKIDWERVRKMYDEELIGLNTQFNAAQDDLQAYLLARGIINNDR